MNLLEKGLPSFIINPDNLINKYKTYRRNPKDLMDYQIPINLFKNIRDGYVNQTELLKNQTNF